MINGAALSFRAARPAPWGAPRPPSLIVQFSNGGVTPTCLAAEMTRLRENLRQLPRSGRGLAEPNAHHTIKQRRIRSLIVHALF